MSYDKLAVVLRSKWCLSERDFHRPVGPCGLGQAFT